jgi:hypothetical protein
MCTLLKPFILFLLAVTALTGCKTEAHKKTILFEVVSDSLYNGGDGYEIKYSEWKKRYEECLQSRLFQNAIYMGLQQNIHIGSISNQYATNINKQFSLFDTSNRKNIVNLLAVINNSNCYTKVNLSKDLQSDFYRELINNLKNSGEYQHLAEYIDSARINFKITTMADNSLRPDSLVSLLQRTKDTSLVQFRQLLLTPGNALLVRTAMILGFYCEFPLKRKFPSGDEAKFKNEVFFKIGDTGESCSIRLLPNQNIQVFINKYYTVFGQFFLFKESN